MTATLTTVKNPSFGLVFDIDGVIMRGKNVLPGAPETFKKLYDHSQEKWRIPAIFLTNAGNTLRQKKADQLTNWLNVPISEDQVVMSHSPLKMFTEFHDKHVLVTGQGPVEHIAKSLGFNNVTTMVSFQLKICLTNNLSVASGSTAARIPYVGLRRS